MLPHVEPHFRRTMFADDIRSGSVGERIFIEDFLDFLNIEYEDVTGRQCFRLIDTDFKMPIGTYEVKANYKDDKQLVIEEYTNYNKLLAPISKGWFYKSKADLIVFVSRATRAMILLPFTEEFKAHYESIKNDYPLVLNRISENNGRKWQSAYRRVPLDRMGGFFSYYKKVAYP